MYRLSAPALYASEFLYARTQAVSPFSHGHSGTHTPDTVLLVCPGVACDCCCGLARATRLVTGALGRGCARRAGCSPRYAADPHHSASGVRAVGASDRQTLVDYVVFQFCGNDCSSKPGMVLAVRHGGPPSDVCDAR